MGKDDKQHCGCRPECEHCDKYAEIAYRCSNDVERNLYAIRKQCQNDTAEQIAQLKAEIEQKHKELNNLCLILNAKIDNVSKTIKIVLGLNIGIAVFGLILCIFNAIYGCPCTKHLTVWGIFSIVLGGLVFLSSIVVAIIGFHTEKNKMEINSDEKQPTTESGNKRKFKCSPLLCTVITTLNFILMVAVILITCLL